ncbi:very short patch repair endonuclease [Faecalibacterium sp. 4P15]|uniref:very short patch repair endonuclease n=1 Tax=Faecalibacterium duncaniae (strain DSM 17677 / JCM 31915 / A2-165) TaxID=411483 RepID=UPI00164AEB11|nr:very short patch repair endonuclease [Faecalibacterium duncaniae]
MKKTPEQIHYNMQRVKCKNTEIELRLRKELWSRGVRYRKNVSKITGKPDIAFIGKKVAVFCDSEFWHGYDWKRQRAAIKSNRDFWIPKIERNIERDKKVNEALKAEGWTVLRFWGNEIKNNVEQCADLVIAALKERD